jgi:hypothetical protein
MTRQSDIIASKALANEGGVEADGLLYLLIARVWRGRIVLANLGTEQDFFFLVFGFNSRGWNSSCLSRKLYHTLFISEEVEKTSFFLLLPVRCAILPS